MQRLDHCRREFKYIPIKEQRYWDKKASVFWNDHSTIAMYWGIMEKRERYFKSKQLNNQTRER